MKLIINELINKCCKENSKKVQTILQFFSDFEKELIQHINYEDTVLFPYALEIESIFEKKQKPKTFQNSIEDYFRQHTNVEEKLNDLKNIFLRYFPATADKYLSFEIIESIFDFLKELYDHQKIEERVLIPKVKTYEILLK